MSTAAPIFDQYPDEISFDAAKDPLLNGGKSAAKDAGFGGAKSGFLHPLFVIGAVVGIVAVAVIIALVTYVGVTMSNKNKTENTSAAAPSASGVPPSPVPVVPSPNAPVAPPSPDSAPSADTPGANTSVPVPNPTAPLTPNASSPAPVPAPIPVSSSVETVTPIPGVPPPTATPVATVTVTECGSVTFPQQLPSGRVVLPISNATNLLAVWRAPSAQWNTTWPTALYRSYEAQQWELAAPTAAGPESLSVVGCDSKCCELHLPQSSDVYFVDRYDTPAPPPAGAASAAVSRFLLQASFGPTVSSLADLVASTGSAPAPDFLPWIKAQLSLPATSHRAFYRRRSHPRPGTGTYIGTAGARLPCAAGSRFTRIALTADDIASSIMKVEVNGATVLQIGGVLRTEVNSTLAADLVLGTNYTICTVLELAGGEVTVTTSKTCPRRATPKFSNFPIMFPVNAPAKLLVLPNNAATFGRLDSRLATADDVLIVKSIPPPCTLESGPSTFISYNNSIWRLDERVVLLDNSPGGADAVVEGLDIASKPCPTVPRTYQNAGTCARATGCSSASLRSVPLTLNETTLRRFYTAGGILMYVVNGLRLEDPYDKSPCAGSSRWKKLNTGACASPSGTGVIDVASRNALRDALVSSADTNPYVRDLSGLSCSAGVSSAGAIIDAGDCWQHVAPDEFSVFDFTSFAGVHQGNNARQNFYPIHAFGESGSVYANFPLKHEMRRFESALSTNLQRVGRYGDIVDFIDMPSSVQTNVMAVELRSLDTSTATLACTSHGEVSNDPAEGSQYPFALAERDFRTRISIDYPVNARQVRTDIFTRIALEADDQLRQRMAWALVQIYVLSEGSGYSSDHVEPHLTYYDIFVRNAFGNLRDILKDVSYSPMMSRFLTYFTNRCLASSGAPPDENFAREIMQLFSIGLYALNDEGVKQTNSDGVVRETYTTAHIVNMARCWTGFVFSGLRGNIAVHDNSANMVDPLTIVPLYRDPFPKPDLANGYIGDAYPTCFDQPRRLFLRAGAKYSYLGSIPQAENRASVDRSYPIGGWGSNSSWLELAPASALYSKLCAMQVNCTFPSEVVLDANLECNGMECLLEHSHPQLIRLTDAKTSDVVYYEYIPLPCVEQGFYDGKVMAESHLTWAFKRKYCGDPRLQLAQPGCCNASGSISVSCPIISARVNFAEAEKQCAASKIGFNQTCAYDRRQTREAADQCLDESGLHWTSTSCSIQAQVDEYGDVLLLHPGMSPRHLTLNDARAKVSFSVGWQRRTMTGPVVGRDSESKFPTISSNCSTTLDETGATMAEKQICVPDGNTCVCDTVVSSSPVFTDKSAIPSREDIVSQCFVGSYSPDTFDAGTFEITASAANVNVYTLVASAGAFDQNTIFKVTLEDKRVLYLVNRLDLVRIPGTTYVFRNPPLFNSIQLAADTNTKFSAHYETDALLDYLFYHPNTAPYISRFLITKFVTSNPSPRYIKAVTTAFRTGTFAGEVGTGKYGDLAATIAAILMHPEARSPVLLMDPSFGQYRESFLKVVHYMRALDYKATDNIHVELNNLIDAIGEEPYNSPSVFNFFMANFQPVGACTAANIISPESTIATGPMLMGFANGLVSLADYGLTAANRGLGTWPPYGSKYAGMLTWQPTGNHLDSVGVVNELDIVLTGGRSHWSTRKYISDAYARQFTSAGYDGALKLAFNLFVFAAEFHTMHYNHVRPAPRSPLPSNAVYQDRPYKATIVLFLNGGCDSWNMFMPHSNCPNFPGLPDDYAATRDVIAVPKNTQIQFDVPTNSQHCGTFGLHPSLDFVKTLYDAEEAAFIANIGSLIVPINKTEYNKKLKPLPHALYAHNTQQQDAQALEVKRAKGVLGRIASALSKQSNPMTTRMYSLSGDNLINAGAPVTPSIISQSAGAIRLFKSSLISDISSLLANETASTFAETANQAMGFAISDAESLGTAMDGYTLQNSFPSGSFGTGFSQIAKIIAQRKVLKSERDFFYIELGGFDMHSEVLNALTDRFDQIDSAIESFAAELRNLSIWDNVVLTTVSEFGRTLNSNGKGSDHGWGGNHFVVGGAVKGKKIHGKYPSTLSIDGDFSVGSGKGRALPTSPWEALWSPIAEWVGVESANMRDVIPKLDNFPNELFARSDFFKN